MGIVNHRIVNVIVSNYQADKVDEYFKSNYELGTHYTKSEPLINGFVQYTMHTSGSKVGWESSDEHKHRCDMLLNFCRECKEDDGSTGVKAVVLEIKENLDGTETITFLGESLNEVHEEGEPQ